MWLQAAGLIGIIASVVGIVFWHYQRKLHRRLDREELDALTDEFKEL